MQITFYKYQGAGNDFLIADNRTGACSTLSTSDIVRLCDRRYGFGADGLMLLEESAEADFKMVFYNPDGSGGMMCGNGGRCIAAFAGSLLRRSIFTFEAADGLHRAEIVGDDGKSAVVRLQMIDVQEMRECMEKGTYFLNTGTRHYVRFVEGKVADMDVVTPGRRYRYSEEFAPEGVNVNFVEAHGDKGQLVVRTYEKGVEDETFACGTGIVACAVAAWHAGYVTGEGRVHVDIMAKRDRLAVDFMPGKSPFATDVWLTGPAVLTGIVRELDEVPAQEC